MNTNLIKTFIMILLSQTGMSNGFAQENMNSNQRAHLARAEVYQCIYASNYGYTIESLGEVDVDYNSSKLVNTKTFSDQSKLTLSVVSVTASIDKKPALLIKAEYEYWKKVKYFNHEGNITMAYDTFSSPKVLREGLFISMNTSEIPRKDLFCSTSDDLGKIELFIQTM